MDPVIGFFVGLLVLLAITIATLVLVQGPLCAILTELCGVDHRGKFWARLFDVTLVAMVCFFSLWSPPKPIEGSVGLLEVLGMFRAGLFGLLMGLAILTVFMLVFIGRYDREQARLRRREVSDGSPC